jgi:hypothetical protein
MSMTSRLIPAAACVLLLLSASACSQSDGPLPVADDETADRLKDLTKDLLNVAGGDRTAPQELSDDVAEFVETPPAVAAARALATRTTTALRNTKLTNAQAARLANDIWIAVAATQLSSNQQKSIQADAKTQLASAGAAADNGQAVADAIGAAQKTVTTRKRRWYERS